MKKENGISLVIALKEMSGIAQNGRSFLSKISLTNFGFDVYDESQFAISDYNYFDKITTNKSQFKKRLIFNTCEKYISPDYYNIKVIFWEFESGMMEFRPKIFENVKQAVVFTDFVYNYLLKISPKNVKITKMKYPFIKNWEINIKKEDIRAKYNIKPEDFVCFFNFDYRSSYKRKNPEMTIRVFAQSIGKYADSKIIIKTFGRENHLEQTQKLKQFTKELNVEEKVIFIDEYLSRNEMISVINACDCYISLHRGEGLGIGMLEAMALGKPVIATNYSGNTEFMDHDNSLLVDYKLVEANDDHEAYKWVEKWAEPNIETAKKYLEKLYSDRGFGIGLGQKAQKFIDTYYNLNDFKMEIKEIFGIIEGENKAKCLLQKRKKLYILQLIKDTFKKIRIIKWMKSRGFISGKK